MTLLDAILLGIIQGLTEFLPISSTAHLTIAGTYLNLIKPDHPEQWTAYIAVIQIGTLIAVLVYFFREIASITAGFIADGFRFVRSPSEGAGRSKLGWLIILGTVPVVIIGLMFKDLIEGHLTKDVRVIATSLILLAAILWIAELVGKRTRTLAQATWIDALVVGFAQSLALIPGSSRSGTTITAGLLVGMRREDAARFSFLLSIPAVFASGLLQLYQMRAFMGELGAANVIVATVVSAIVGYASIEFLLRYLRTHSTAVFIAYRIVLGAILWWLAVQSS